MTPKWIVVDIETAGREDAAALYLPGIKPKANLVKPDLIAADIATKQQAAHDDAALDWNTSRIVALGYQTEDSEPTVLVCRDEDEERVALNTVWHAYLSHQSSRRIVGFNSYGFDVPTMIQRSRILGVRVPTIDMRKYGNNDQIDIFKVLTFDDMQRTYVMLRTLANFCQLFGIAADIPDDTSGADVAAMLAAGDYDGIRSHCLTDVLRTQALAQRLGYISAPVLEAVAI